MSILFVLLMFLLVMSISYFRTRHEVAPDVWAGPQVPRMQREYGFSIPEGYAFHPGHTWVLKEGGENARVGIDSFAANLLGKIDHVDVIGLNRWVRQGQKLVSFRVGDKAFEVVSPVEGRDHVDQPGCDRRPQPDRARPLPGRMDCDGEVTRPGHEPEEPGAGRHGRALATRQRDPVERNGHAARADHGRRPRVAGSGAAAKGAARTARDAGEGIFSGLAM